MSPDRCHARPVYPSPPLTDVSVAFRRALSRSHTATHHSVSRTILRVHVYAVSRSSAAPSVPSRPSWCAVRMAHSRARTVPTTGVRYALESRVASLRETQSSARRNGLRPSSYTCMCTYRRSSAERHSAGEAGGRNAGGHSTGSRACAVQRRTLRTRRTRLRVEPWAGVGCRMACAERMRGVGTSRARTV